MRALITWASSWFGAEFAKQLAAKWYDLILAARSTDKMVELWEELKAKFWISYEVYTVDLWEYSWIENLCNDIIDKREIDLLINNAWRWNLNWFLNSTDEDHASMMTLNMMTLVLNSKRYVKKLIKENKKWKIINVASLASFLFDWTWPLYSATKAFARSISYWIDATIEEVWKQDDIKIQCLCPWLTKTHFMWDKFTMSDLDKFWFMEASEVVEISLNALEKDEFIVIPWEQNQESAKHFHNTPIKEVRKEMQALKKQTWLIF